MRGTSKPALECARLWAIAQLLACAPAETAAVDAALPGDARPVPAVGPSTQLCKLLSGANTSDPSPNAVQLRANLRGADLGIPVATASRFYLLFGDTLGFAGIWGGGEAHPDAVGYAVDPPAAIAADPARLCAGLRVITLPHAQSIGPTVDARIEADFAGAAMIAPPGHQLVEYIHDPAGGFPNLPGDFEVPSGAYAIGDAIDVFYTTVRSPADRTMIGAYLARWDAPAVDAIPAYHVVGAIDDADFVNIAAVPHGDWVYLFGTGAFRASPVHLARMHAGVLPIERFDAATGTWGAAGAPIIPTPGHGETSVRYFAELDRWMFLAEELTPTSNRIVARFAGAPEGPWSAAQVVLDMADPAFRARYCCAAADACAGPQFLACDRTGFYASYLFPDVRLDPGGFTATFTLSSFDPYDVALFQTSFVAP